MVIFFTSLIRLLFELIINCLFHFLFRYVLFGFFWLRRWKVKSVFLSIVLEIGRDLQLPKNIWNGFRLPFSYESAFKCQLGYSSFEHVSARRFFSNTVITCLPTHFCCTRKCCSQDIFKVKQDITNPRQL